MGNFLFLLFSDSQSNRNMTFQHECYILKINSVKTKIPILSNCYVAWSFNYFKSSLDYVSLRYCLHFYEVKIIVWYYRAHRQSVHEGVKYPCDQCEYKVSFKFTDQITINWIAQNNEKL